jgi:endonuclease/exonuclease/phosphatase family metal-dependent hydrolase
MRVATWNLFHGRSQPGVRADLIGAFAGALRGAAPVASSEAPDGGAWDVIGLQEVPPWWPAALGRDIGASVRTVRTSLLRSAAPGLQQAIHRRDPECLGARGAAVNALLVRPSAGVIDAHRVAVLRHGPQRRTIHAVRLVRPFGRGIWIANLHAHNRPLGAAAADVRAALRVAAAWAGDERLVVLGDLNLQEDDARAVATEADFAWLHGHRVDHVLGRGLRADGHAFAERLVLPGGSGPRTTSDTSGDVGLSDHRLVGVQIADA